MPKLSEDNRKAWIDELLKKLSDNEKENKLDLIVPYNHVSNAFPNGPHSDYFDVMAIDFKALSTWAKSLGWTVKTAPECTVPEQQSTPFIRFTKMGYVSEE
jgi:hypothetical protein